MQDGNAFRTDATHHPDAPEEYGAFLEWAQRAVTLDAYTIPCTDKQVGGKVRSKLPT
jgi:hypothetical protein